MSLAEILAAAHATAVAERGVECVYRRGGVAVPVTATVGRTNFAVADAVGALIESETRDYLIAAPSLAIEGAPFEPAAGDRIEEFVDGQTAVYEVAAPAGAQPWRWSDSYRQIYRIHTLRVS